MYHLLSEDFGEKARKLINQKNLEVINHPNGFMKKILDRDKKVTVITAAFNAEKFIGKTIESVLNQSLGTNQIEYIIVDDCSTDKTAEIAKSYAVQHKNITLVTLHENTGSPGTPRNIGIELATTDYITFLDADDWLHPDGVESLYSILEETNDDYVVGKTIKVEKKGESIIGEFASVTERRSISPYDVPHFFYHMGPTARMVKRELLINKNIRFPEMRFGEDKVFFSDIFFSTNRVSTTVQPVYYVNRMEENKESLTKTTAVLDKRKNDLEIIHYIKNKRLPLHKEKTILTRIYEYDFMRTFDSNLFVNSNNKEEFFHLFNQVLETTKDLRFPFLEDFKMPLFKAGAELFIKGRLDDFKKLFKWHKKEKHKKYVIKDNKPYFEIPFLEAPYHLIRIPMLSIATDQESAGEQVYKQTFEVYGDYVNEINEIVIRDRAKVDHDLICKAQVIDNKGSFLISVQELNRLDDSLYTIFVRYNEYQLANLKVIPMNHISYRDREFLFYTTKADNLGLSVKPAME
jgi:glycosyltransferase involved in cell wall biosynthesis